MHDIVITTGSGSYTGPITLIAWMLLHPWMTFFIAMSFFSAIEELFKSIRKRK